MGFDFLDYTKNLGSGHTELDHFSVDFWNDTMFLNNKIYSLGYFAVSLLNIDDAKIAEVVNLCGIAKEYISSCKEKDFNITEFKNFGDNCRKIFDFIANIEPFSLLDISSAKDQLEDSIGEDVIFFIEGNKDFLEYSEMRMKPYFSFVEDIVLLRNGLKSLFKNHLSKEVTRDEHSFAVACHNYFFSGGKELFYTEQIKSKDYTLPFFPDKAKTSSMMVVTKHPEEEKMIFIERFYFDSLKDFIVTDLMKSLHYGHSFSRCEICNIYFLNTSARNPKYCDGFAPNHPKGFTCRQEGAARGRKEKEQSADHPIKAICTTRLNTINKHRKAGIISEDFAKKAKQLAQEKRDRALFDNDYFSSSYEQDLSQKSLYEEVEKLIK